MQPHDAAMRRNRITTRSVRALLLLALLVAGVAALTLLWPGSPGPEPRAAAATDWQPRPELLVSTAWLAGHRTDAALRIVDLRDAEAYAAGHVPGAVHVPAGALFATVDGIEGMLPPLDAVAGALGGAGIGPEHTVVAYDDANGLYAARLFWVLDYLGHGGGRLLDGGWPKWQAEGRPVTQQAARPTPANFTPQPRPARIADLAWVRARLEDPAVVLVDARSMLEYRGITRYADYGGHIPGAVHMEWKHHLRADGTLRPPEALRAEYAALGVTPGREAVVYCQIMVRAAHSYFTLRWLGMPRVRAYDGSWAEWGNREDTPKAVL